MALSVLGLPAPGSAKSTPMPAGCWRTTGQTFDVSTTSSDLDAIGSPRSIWFAADSHVKTCRWRASVAASVPSVLACSTRWRGFAMGFDPATSLSKMFPDCYLPTMDEISQGSCGPWPTSGISEPGGCWTASSSEFPSADAGYSVCSLADVLEPCAAPKYSLSARAATGILRRAAKRGRQLPAALHQALSELAATGERRETSPSR